MITYNETARLVFDLNRYTTKDQAAAAVRRISYSKGETNIADALTMASAVFTASHGDRPEAENIAILLSDGRATSHVNNITAAASQLKRKTFVTSVGVTDKIDEKELSAISSNGLVYTVSEFNRLNSILQDVLKDACQITEAPSKWCQIFRAGFEQVRLPKVEHC